ncbi:Pentatricopeptide repeat - like 10 [Theobroma cacao]|nr:Pentatricopeptide repeat - like 10 [Theobroma cacao]
MVSKTALRFASAANGAALSSSSSKSTPKDALCKVEKLEEANGLLDLMIQRGVDPDIFTYNTLMDGYCLAGSDQNKFNKKACHIVEKLRSSLEKPLIQNVQEAWNFFFWWISQLSLFQEIPYMLLILVTTAILILMIQQTVRAIKRSSVAVGFD